MRPKTQQCYSWLSRTFVAFTNCAKIDLSQLKVMHILFLLEHLVEYNVSCHVYANYVSALRANLRGLGGVAVRVLASNL